MVRAWKAFVLVSVIGLAAACRDRSYNAESGSEIEFAIFKRGQDHFGNPADNLQHSILPLLGSRESVTVCVYTAGGVGPELARKGFEAMQGAIGEWTALLAENPQWERRTPPRVVLGQGGQRCNGDLLLYMMADEEELRSFTGQAKPLYSMVDAHAVIITETALERLKACGTYDTLDKVRASVILHEVGHLMGLADTYEAPDYQTGIGFQPPGAMQGLDRNGCRIPLAYDDKAAVNALATHLLGGRQQTCPEGYRAKIGAQGNMAGATFYCESTAKCVSYPVAGLPFQYLVTDANEIVVLGNGFKPVARLQARARSDVMQLEGQRIRVHFDARSGTGAGVFVYSRINDGKILLSHDGRHGAVPMACRNGAIP